jgi:hypothetical protein
MPVSPPEVHAVAERLWDGTAVDKMTEACARAVAGRSYYSAYLSTREALRAAYSDQTFDVGHQPLWAFLLGSGDSTLRLAGNLLKTLCTARELADYNLTGTLKHREAEVLVDDARDVLSMRAELERRLRALPQRPPRRG